LTKIELYKEKIGLYRDKIELYWVKNDLHVYFIGKDEKMNYEKLTTFENRRGYVQIQ
jgi:hypothetical protein